MARNSFDTAAVAIPAPESSEAANVNANWPNASSRASSGCSRRNDSNSPVTLLTFPTCVGASGAFAVR